MTRSCISALEFASLGHWYWKGVDTQHCPAPSLAAKNTLRKAILYTALEKKKKKMMMKTSITLQTLLSLYESPHSRDLINHIPDLHLPLPDLELDLLPALETDCYLRKLRRISRKMCDLDVDVCRAVGGRSCWVLQEIEGEATGPGEPREGREGGAEVGDCLDGNRHF